MSCHGTGPASCAHSLTRAIFSFASSFSESCIYEHTCIVCVCARARARVCVEGGAASMPKGSHGSAKWSDCNARRYGRLRGGERGTGVQSEGDKLRVAVGCGAGRAGSCWRGVLHILHIFGVGCVAGSKERSGCEPGDTRCKGQHTHRDAGRPRHSVHRDH
jgi:hypothetical protein